MRIVRDLAQARSASRSYVTIGVFDGIHRGHQQLIAGMIEAAHLAHNVAITITFDPHPATTLGYEHPSLLTTVEERTELLTALGLDLLVVLPFNLAIARTSAADFVAGLTRHLHLAELWGGPDFSFGYRREGNIPFLRRLGSQRGFTVRVVEPLVWEGAPVSSSRVRAALKAGDISQAMGCLGRPYRLAGAVVRGRGPGHRPGVPVVNLSPPPDRLVPASGIYACLANTERLGTYPAVTNIFTRSTTAGQAMVVVAHLLDCDTGLDLDLGGQTLALDFVARLRDERPLSTPDVLTEQLPNDVDVAQARAILGSVIPPEH